MLKKFIIGASALAFIGLAVAGTALLQSAPANAAAGWTVVGKVSVKNQAGKVLLSGTMDACKTTVVKQGSKLKTRFRVATSAIPASQKVSAWANLGTSGSHVSAKTAPTTVKAGTVLTTGLTPVKNTNDGYVYVHVGEITGDYGSPVQPPAFKISNITKCL